MAGHYRLGERLPAALGNMWDIIRGYAAAAPGLSRSRLIAAMMSRNRDQWPAAVLHANSVQGVGSELWCTGCINGAVREGYLLRD